MSETVWMAACRIGDIPAGEGRTFELGDRSIAVFHQGGEYFAIDDQCPHMGASLASGFLDGCTVACPWHAWRFDIRDGAWCDNPKIKIGSYPTRLIDDELWVQIPSKEETMPRPQPVATPAVDLRDFQKLIRQMYFEKDQARGVEGTFMWLMEEVGELSSALRQRDRENQIEEFADVLAWLATIANVCEIDLSEALQRKYGTGCPGCRQFACTCPDSEKP